MGLDWFMYMLGFGLVCAHVGVWIGLCMLGLVGLYTCWGLDWFVYMLGLVGLYILGLDWFVCVHVGV